MPPRHRIELHLNCLIAAQLANEAFGHAEVHIHGRQIFQIHQIRTIFHKIAHVHIANTHRAIKRCNHAHALPTRAGERKLSLHHLHLRSRFIHHTLRHKILRHQLLISLQISPRNTHLRLRLAYFSALQRVF